MSKLIFPKNFIFGSATAAYQIEGAVTKDGRGPSVWDTFSHKKGKINNNDNGDIACDHYHRYRDDVDLMQQLGLDAYRLSISWSRIMPAGTGEINQAGLTFYRNLIDELIAAGITPYVTLFHWDMPQALDDEYGGFLSRQCAYDFANYVEVVVKALGDKVKNWITLNEPWEHGCLGYVMGKHAPGKVKPWRFLSVMHHQLLAHGLAVKKIRQHCQDAHIGITLSFTPIHPKSSSIKDQQAAAMANEFINFITLDPLLKGHYPEKLWHKFKCFKANIEDGDWQVIRQAIDFIGINNYSREFAHHNAWVPVLNAWIDDGGEVPTADFIKNGVQHTSMGWEVYPQGLSEVLAWFREDYGNPKVYITENGAAFNDKIEHGVINDVKRIEFLSAYMTAAKQAIDDGSNLHGYFVWSFLDNFEWAAGFDKQFGLVHVDYQNQQRTIKNSGYWYRDIISDNKSHHLNHSKSTL
jgi:beta-glucosidase